jgi:hypothetical protein
VEIPEFSLEKNSPRIDLIAVSLVVKVSNVHFGRTVAGGSLMFFGMLGRFNKDGFSLC